MGLKKYIFGSVVLILVIFGYAFSLESGDYRIEILESVFILPIAVWIVIPVLVLFIMTILHILFYGLKNYFSLKSVDKDIESVKTLLSKKLVGEDSNVIFKNETFKELSEIIKQLNIEAKDETFSSSDKKLDKTVSQIASIKNGKYVSSKDLKLQTNSELMTQNTKNRIAEDVNFALDAVKKSSNNSLDIVKVAFDKVLETKSMTTIKKSIDEIVFDKSMIIALLEKDAKDQNEFSMNNDMILNLVKKVEFTNEELISIAKNYKTSMSPDQLIKLFEDISLINEDYTTSYLYVLAQFEMVDSMRDILVNSENNEYSAFKAIIDLKDAGKNTYSLDTLCYK
ncbi:MAG: hypothetical protein U9R39_07020 [Campylobacterota bacterium]|nr:hypothetical protein [Campylobacterota bacterium]